MPPSELELLIAFCKLGAAALSCCAPLLGLWAFRRRRRASGEATRSDDRTP
ncbi:hypothetical protein [Streptomyces sp. NPDC052036]|uniref:hypothetical protein n=1 Tax=unclassified Streptomyces TaxID=2593676 RepID=UPI00343EA4DB